MNIIKFAYNSNGVRLLPLSLAVEKLKEIGYQGIEISLDRCHFHPFINSIQELSEIKRFIVGLDMPICAVHTGSKYALGKEAFEPSLIASEPWERQKRLDFICASIDAAVWLGAPVCTVTSGFKSEEISDQDAEVFLLEALNKIFDYAGTRIKVCIEPEPGMYVGSLEKAIAVRDSLNKNLFVTLDVGHAECNSEDYLSFITKHYDIIGHMHIEDIANKVHQHLIPGNGDINFPALLQAIQNCDYKGYVSVELYTYNDKAIEAAQESLFYLNNAVKENS